MQRIHRQAHRVLPIALLFFLASCSATQAPPSEPGPPPRTIKFTSPDQLAHLRVRPAAGRSRRGRIIYIGVYGGEVPSWDRARYFVPKDWPPYKNLIDEEGLARVAFHDSLMHVLGLEISRHIPDSIALMIKGDTDVVTDAVKYLYSAGDKLYLVGHSQGGAVVADAVRELKKAAIPVQMLALMEGFQSYGTVPSNVAQAFNFYVPSKFSFCPGRVKLDAEDPAATRVTNVPIENPWGPFTGFCAEHRNVDSDPRVWKPVLQYIIDSAGG
ncbi:MAG TPA: hypothetical protein VGL11_01935 [Candidatus Binatia bacterium]|jgi:pimeloyl-ACP methyl ester carboxylesterase